MKRPRLLDLFCGAGGAAMGYHRAGFDVVGVDIKPQPHYPFEFIQGDVMKIAKPYARHGDLAWSTLLSRGADKPYWVGPLGHFDAVHASPPCQNYSHGTVALDKDYPDLIAPTRELLGATELPYVIENVKRAPLLNPVTVCGSFACASAVDDDGTDLFLRRHRLFESNIPLRGNDCICGELKAKGWKIGGVYGGARSNRWEAENIRHGGYTPSFGVQQKLMGIDWMTRKELYEAVPPSYTYAIGRQLIDFLASSGGETP